MSNLSIKSAIYAATVLFALSSCADDPKTMDVPVQADREFNSQQIETISPSQSTNLQTNQGQDGFVSVENNSTITDNSQIDHNQALPQLNLPNSYNIGAKWQMTLPNSFELVSWATDHTATFGPNTQNWLRLSNQQPFNSVVNFDQCGSYSNKAALAVLPTGSQNRYCTSEYRPGLYKIGSGFLGSNHAIFSTNVNSSVGQTAQDRIMVTNFAGNYDQASSVSFFNKMCRNDAVKKVQSGPQMILQNLRMTPHLQDSINQISASVYTCDTITSPTPFVQEGWALAVAYIYDVTTDNVVSNYNVFNIFDGSTYQNIMIDSITSPNMVEVVYMTNQIGGILATSQEYAYNNLINAVASMVRVAR